MTYGLFFVQHPNGYLEELRKSLPTEAIANLRGVA